MKIFLLVATHYGVGLTSVSLSLLHKLDSLGYKTGFFKPVSQTDNPIDQSTKLAEVLTDKIIYSKISCVHAKNKFASGQQELLMEEIIATFEKQNNNLDALVIEGLMPVKHLPYANQINSAVAKSLNAGIIIVSEVYNMSTNAITNAIEITASTFSSSYSSNILGYILNKVLTDDKATENKLAELAVNNKSKIKFKCLANMPYNPEFSAPLMRDLADELQADIINKGEINTRRVKYYTLIARTVENALDSIKPGNLIITPADRSDIILAVCMAALSGVKLAGLLLTGGITPAVSIMQLCKHALETGLPIISINCNSYATVALIDRLPKKISVKDKNHLHKIVHEMSLNIKGDNFKKYFQGITQKTLSPAAFRYRLIKKAKQQLKTIVLPEGHDLRIIESAIICHQRNIANCILLGNEEQINKLASDSGLTLPDNLIIKQPDNIRSNYVEPLIEVRKHKKKLNEIMALSSLEDDIVLGTMMLALNEVDGLVAGACTTTANTLRPAFQIIKSSGGLVSSIFFMLMPTDVFIYGDCAVNVNPSAEQLALIAMQSADSAKLFGIEPKIAMISYSTGMSGAGDDVELVRQATAIIQQQRSDLIIDGPLQYDAASVSAVAKTKAPNSKVAGNANVFIFPDLNTGNTTYKAVQRSAGVVSLGPMLQGLNKPVNDLSRGASIDDIVYTIALTAIQAQNQTK